ncbi:MAG: ABC transporter ATP-binding protein [Candidatus Cloacimonadaceae bacterium]|nr:ABC transporter ATP-binding protein [Candidatus Cloacimonadaceae bacterium]MDP3113811.1 ABC transporter ATP-binding protein [Candidatus Cloacimonadaceae bacterium]
MNIINALDLSKVYLRGAEEIRAVNKISIDIEEGDFVSFVGASGSGKTTLLHLLGCLDDPSGGYLNIAGQVVFENGKAMPESKLTKVRRNFFGYIFQKFYLIPTLTVKENIMVPFAFHRNPDIRINVNDVAKLLGLEKRLNHLPKEISGGEMQRVAIARALINNPKVILADEPTGNLDSKRSEEIADILTGLNRDRGITIILVTHNHELAKRAGRIMELIDGNLIT